VFGVNEVLWRAELVSSVGRSKSDRFARAKLWLFGVKRGQHPEGDVSPSRDYGGKAMAFSAKF
jgi:hypothetical protein